MDWNEIGTGDAACQNPPELTEHDGFVYTWYSENITGFAMEFGLMPELLKSLKLKEEMLSLFLLKCDMIYQSSLRVQEKERKDNG